MAILQKLLETTPEELGRGRDVLRPGRYRRLELATAWRIEHPRLWRKYAVERQSVAEQLQQLPEKPPRLQLRPVFSKAGAELPDKLMTEVNEVRLLHGSKPEKILSLLDNGLNERFSGGKFGHGTYLAEDAGKNDQYCTPDDSLHAEHLQDLHDQIYRDGVEHAGTVYYLILCRVVMGSFASCKKGDPDAKIMGSSRKLWATDERRELANVSDGTFPHHGLLVEVGEEIRRYREIVQFHDTRIFPEYLLAYMRK
mmetsp:Transcript_56283/g.131160  ORF Transcript_56283/g.131160 Transcript_56283/m.131160 type:complete len:254 (-) Transcript_56283:219-980(-)